MKNYNIHNILKIKSDIEGIFPDEFLVPENFLECDLEIMVKKEKDIDIERARAIECMPGVFYSSSKKEVFSKFSLGNISFVSKIDFGEKMKFEISPAYYKLSRNLIRVPVSSFFPLEHFLKLIVQILLLSKSKSFLISSGLSSPSGEGVLVMSFGGMGKTTMALDLMKRKSDWKFLGDDTLITDGTAVYAYPRKIRLRKFGSAFLSYNKNTDPERIFQKERMAEKNFPQKLFILERGGEERIYKKSFQEAWKTADSIHRKILPFDAERMLMAANAAGILDTDYLISEQRRIIKKLMENMDIFAVSATSREKCAELILKQKPFL